MDPHGVSRNLKSLPVQRRGDGPRRYEFSHWSDTSGGAVPRTPTGRDS